MTDIHGDLFERRQSWRLFLLCMVVGAAMWLGCAASALAQKGGGDAVLSRRISLASSFNGSVDSLVAILSRETGVYVAYSSRVMSPRGVRLGAGRHSVRQCLDAAFGRYNVRYVCHEGKIVVASDSVRMRRLSGFCRDAQTGEALIGAYVSDTLLGRVTATNEYGFFSLSVPTGRVPARASYIGYKAGNMTVRMTNDTMVEIRLEPRVMLAAVDVKGRSETEADIGRTGIMSLPMEQVRSMPTLMGEADVTRALQQTPGVQSGSEGFGGMSVRGGGQDQNMVYLDDAPLYNANHMLGLFSVFNSEAVSQSTLLKSGFPARYGGRMSSVLDVKTLDGNLESFEGDANVGLVSSSLLAQGPMKRGRSSYLFSARRSYFDVILYQLQNDDNRYSYMFYDFHGKMNWVLSERDRLRLSLFYSRDRLSDDSNMSNVTLDYGEDDDRKLTTSDETRSKWGTALGSLRWSHVFGSTAFSNVTAWYSQYQFRTSQRYGVGTSASRGILGDSYSNGIIDMGVRCDVSVYPSIAAFGKIRIGGWGTYRIYRPVMRFYTPSSDMYAGGDVSDKSSDTGDIERLEFHAYLEDSWRRGPMWLMAGVHLTIEGREDDSPYVVAEPRLTAGLRASERLKFRVGGSLTSQNTYQMRIMNVATPADFWLPVPKTVGAQRTWQVSVAGELNMAADFSLVVEAYNKWMVKAATYSDISVYDIVAGRNWDDLYAEGDGYARGVEFFLHRRKGRVSGWVGYALSKARNRYPTINEGAYLPADNDRLHSIQLFGMVKLTSRAEVSAMWSYGSGSPFSLPTQHYSLPGSDVTYAVPAKRNAMRMPENHQLNLGCNLKFGDKREGSVLSFGVYNVYGRHNPMFVYWRKNQDEGVPSYSLKQFSLIAFPCPYIKYSIHF